MNLTAKGGAWLVVIGLFLMALIPCASALPGRDGEISPQEILEDHQADAAPGEYLVKFRESADRERARRDISALGVSIVRDYRGSGLARVKIPKEGRARIRDTLGKDRDIEYIEPNYVIRIASVPADPLFFQLWGLQNTGQNGGTPDADIDAPEAWDIALGNPAVAVAVIDTGVDYNHPDLAANIWTNPGEIPGNGIDDDRNGYVDDVHGWNAVTNTGDPMDDNGHGTHCAGTIAARSGNGIGVAGVAPQAKIVACKFMGRTGAGYLSDAIECIDYANSLVDHGTTIRVHSYSWGSSSNSRALSDAINRARTRGVLVAAAAGNGNQNIDVYGFYPAGYALDNIVSVGATDNRDARAYFSNFGRRNVDVMAPGVNILSTVPGTSCGAGGCYAVYSGTSMAAPHVAGTAALLFGRSPGAPYAVVRNAILSSADRKTGLFTLCLTGGRLNAYRAVITL